MSKVKVRSFSVSLDGYAAGPHQSLENPLGQRGGELHTWVFPTKMFQKMHGNAEGTEGTEGVDNDFAEKSFENIGAWILGRNMFGPVRGPWPNDEWKGWWGETPPYKVPVFVLTHHARESITMKGGTVFHFITEGIHVAMERAKEAAKGKDIRIGGGAATIRQFLKAGYIDEIHFAFSPVFLGAGELLFDGGDGDRIDLPALGFTVVETAQGKGAMHVVLKKSK